MVYLAFHHSEFDRIITTNTSKPLVKRNLFHLHGFVDLRQWDLNCNVLIIKLFLNMIHHLNIKHYIKYVQFDYLMYFDDRFSDFANTKCVEKAVD